MMFTSSRWWIKTKSFLLVKNVPSDFPPLTLRHLLWPKNGIKSLSYRSKPTSEMAVETLERVFHLIFSNQIRKSSSYVGALGCTGARLAGLVLTAEARSLLDW